MINFLNVAGECIVEDGLSSREAYSGMAMDSSGRTCVIATGPGGCATVNVNGQRCDLGPNSWMNICPQPSRVHDFRPGAHALRTFVGRLWSHLEQNPNDEGDWNSSTNAAVGIRG